MADNIEPTTHLEKVIAGEESPITHLEQVIAQYGGSRTDELVKMDSTTDAKYLSDLIDKSTVVNDNGVLKVKKLDGQEVTIAEINHLKGLTMNVMDLVNAFANGGVKVYERTIPTYADLLVLDRSGFIDGIKYFVYVQSDETHDGTKTTYICDKNSTSYFCVSGDHRDFTTNPIDLVNEVTGKLGTSNIDVDALWKLLTINDTYKTLTTKNEPFGTHGAKALYDELVADIGKKANATDLTSHTSDTNIHITTAERTKWNKVDNKVDKTSILSAISNTPSDDKLLSEKAINDTLAKKLNLTGGTVTGALTINNNYPTINLSLQGQSTDKVAEDIRFFDGNGLVRSCVRSNIVALEFGQRPSKDGSKWYDGSALLLNENGSFNLRASDSNGENRKSLIGTSTDLKWNGNKVITEDQLYGYITYFPKTIQFGVATDTTANNKWVKIFEFTPNEYAWNSGNFIITFSSLNAINSCYPFSEYELIWKCNSRGVDGITDVYLNQIIGQNGDICHTRGSVLCVGISENKKTVGLYAFLGVGLYQTMLATIISGGSRYENNQSEIRKWINIDKPTVGLEEQPTFSKANYYSLADNLGGWTYTATKLPVSTTNVKDVPTTTITPTLPSTVTLGKSQTVSYSIKNGWAHVSIVMQFASPKLNWAVIATELPKPDKTVNVSTVGETFVNAGVAYRIKTDGTLEMLIATEITQLNWWNTNVSYPVVES